MRDNKRGLKAEMRSGLKEDLRPERENFIAKLIPERSEMVYFRSLRMIFTSKRARTWPEMHGRARLRRDDLRTDVRELTPVSYKTSALWRHCSQRGPTEQLTNRPTK